MNQIILSRVSTNQNKLQCTQNQTKSSHTQFRRYIGNKIKMSQEPNLQMNMLPRESKSRKKYQLGSDRYSLLQKQIQKPIKTEKIIGKEPQKLCINFHKKINEMIRNNDQDQLLIRQSSINLKHQKIYLYQKNKTKQFELETFNKINITAPISRCFARQDKDQKEGNNAINFSKSLSCKTQAVSYRANKQVLLQGFQNNQGQQASIRVVLKMNRRNDKKLYDQAIKHFFELTKHNILQGKVRSQMPCELDVNKIVIPKRGYRQEWIQKLKKNKKIQLKNRDQFHNEDSLKMGGYFQQTDRRSKMKKRAMTDAKPILQLNRNQTEIDKKQFWINLTEKPFEPWQYENVNSNFFQ